MTMAATIHARMGIDVATGFLETTVSIGITPSRFGWEHVEALFEGPPRLNAGR